MEGTLDRWTKRTTKSRLVAASDASSSSSSASGNALPRWKTKVAQAMQLSRLSTQNITAAYAAADLWEKLLNEPTVDVPVQGLCHTIYATTLVRLGRDDQALRSYDTALSYASQLDEETQISIHLGQAACWQRLLDYDLALQAYQMASTAEGAWGAFVCAMRAPNITLAREILFRAVQRYPENTRLTDAYNTWQTLFDDQARDKDKEWDNLTHWKPKDLSSMVEFNVGPFDDPFLRYLDDKIDLHNLLMRHANRTERYWPPSFVWPLEKGKWQDDPASHPHESTSMWMVKTRAGYGSHGNAILPAREISSMLKDKSSSLLVQKIIDKPLLFKQRVCSLRIYVHYTLGFPPLVSSLGLVKLAALRFQADSFDAATRMTNSGRYDDTDQIDLNEFRKSVGNEHYERIFLQIQSAVETVINIYADGTAELVNDVQCRQYRNRLQLAGFPKVLGFDFLVDQNDQPWLLEVNRFPGLEPRNDQDAQVKEAVLVEAWEIATERISSR